MENRPDHVLQSENPEVYPAIAFVSNCTLATTAWTASVPDGKISDLICPSSSSGFLLPHLYRARLAWFEVYACTAAERQYALEVWRLLDSNAALIPVPLRRQRIVNVGAGRLKTLPNSFGLLPFGEEALGPLAGAAGEEQPPMDGELVIRPRGYVMDDEQPPMDSELALFITWIVGSCPWMECGPSYHLRAGMIEGIGEQRKVAIH
eukprot:1158773-Pelagomonas_calceolata.AAC.27